MIGSRMRGDYAGEAKNGVVMNPVKEANNSYMQANIFIHTNLKKSMLKYEIIFVLLVLGIFSQMFIAISTIIIMLGPFIAAIKLLVPDNSKEHELRVDKQGVNWGLKSGKKKHCLGRIRSHRFRDRVPLELHNNLSITKELFARTQ
jgi:hypothetical protein